MSDVPASVVADVAALAHRAGVNPPAIVIEQGAGLARAEQRGRRPARLCLRPALLQAPRDVRRAVIAHELAHLVLEHARRARRRLIVVATILAGVVALGLAVGHSAPQRAQLALVGAGTVFLGGQVMVARASRRAELDADLDLTRFRGHSSAWAVGPGQEGCVHVIESSPVCAGVPAAGRRVGALERPVDPADRRGTRRLAAVA